MKRLLTTAAAIFVIACNASPLQVSSRSVGSRADHQGTITDTGLQYTFKRPLNAPEVSDVINSIYFQGDCIHFTFTLNRIVPKEKISVIYSGPGGAVSMPAERLEIRENTMLGIPTGLTVYGFSLVGSVLERFHKQDLGAPAPHGNYCCKDIPFEITLRVVDTTVTVKETMSASFNINYK